MGLVDIKSTEPEAKLRDFFALGPQFQTLLCHQDQLTEMDTLYKESKMYKSILAPRSMDGACPNVLHH